MTKKPAQEKAIKPEEKKEVTVRQRTTKKNDLIMMTDSIDQVKKLRAVVVALKDEMVPDIDYGLIPGTKKPSLYKSGAERVSRLFGVYPEYEIKKEYLDDSGNIEYEIICNLVHPTHGKVGSGVGLCTTMESKYRYRKGGDSYKIIGERPADYAENKNAYRAKKQGMKDVDGNGNWKLVQFSKGEKIENQNPYDNHNTVLKMAKKRAFVDANLTMSGVSDIFTQDIEDIKANESMHDEYETTMPTEYNTTPKEKPTQKIQETKPEPSKPQPREVQAITVTAEDSKTNMTLLEKLCTIFTVPEKMYSEIEKGAHTTSPDAYEIAAKNWVKNKVKSMIEKGLIKSEFWDEMIRDLGGIGEAQFWGYSLMAILEALETIPGIKESV